MPDMYNPDYTSPEIQNAIDAVTAQKTAEVIAHFQKVAQVAVLNAIPEADREKVADDKLTKVANGKLPAALLAAAMMHDVGTNKEACLAGAAEVAALREKVASKAPEEKKEDTSAKAIFAKKK